MMRKTVLTALAAGALLAAGSASADIRPEVRFPRGATGVTLEGSVVRGDRDIYRIGARAGQTLRVRVRSTEDNAVVQVYPAGTRPIRADWGWDFSQAALPGATEEDGATEVSLRLPRNGAYLVVVGPTRGNASYSVAISIR